MDTPDVLAVTQGPEQGVRFPLGEGSSARIGRDPEAVDLVLTDPRVSRSHARVWIEGGLLLVEDLGSTAGTLVNGAPATRPTALRTGDVLTLGATTLSVLWVPAPAATMVGTVPEDLLAAAPPPPPAATPTAVGPVPDEAPGLAAPGPDPEPGPATVAQAPPPPGPVVPPVSQAPPPPPPVDPVPPPPPPGDAPVVPPPPPSGGWQEPAPPEPRKLGFLRKRRKG